MPHLTGFGGRKGKKRGQVGQVHLIVLSHYTPGDRREASQKRDAVQSELLAGFLDKLKATKEPDGTCLFDHTALTYGSNIRTIHYLDNRGRERTPRVMNSVG